MTMNTLTHNNNSFNDLSYQLYKHMSDKYEVLKNQYPKFIINNKQQSSHILGPTANYNPMNQTITVYSFGRHPKDMLRSFAHEVIHHIQNCEGRLANTSTHEGYTLDDPRMTELEREAYEQGNMCFREFEDLYKRNTPISEGDSSMYADKLQKQPGSIKSAAKKIDIKAEFPEAFTAWFNTLGITKDKVNVSSIKSMVGNALSQMGFN